MAETVALIDYGAGNLKSAQNALLEAARRDARAITVDVTADPQRVLAADRILLPGVGAFAACMRAFDAAPGLHAAMEEAVLVRGRPFLGVCVGLQLLAEAGLEHGRTRGLDWLGGEVAALRPTDPALKLPHMGWNSVRQRVPHPVLDGADGRYFYFVHGYAMRDPARGAIALTCDYGGEFAAAAVRDTVVGVQFHPEKSQAAGLALLSRFLRWRP